MSIALFRLNFRANRSGLDKYKKAPTIRLSSLQSSTDGQRRVSRQIQWISSLLTISPLLISPKWSKCIQQRRRRQIANYIPSVMAETRTRYDPRRFPSSFRSTWDRNWVIRCLYHRLPHDRIYARSSVRSGAVTPYVYNTHLLKTFWSPMYTSFSTFKFRFTHSTLQNQLFATYCLRLQFVQV